MLYRVLRPVVLLSMVLGSLLLQHGASVAHESAILPLATGSLFIENVGQYDPQVLFLGLTDQGPLSLARDGLGLIITEDRAPEAVMDPRQQLHAPPPVSDGVVLRFVDANPQVQMVPEQPLGTEVSYFIGADSTQWHTGLGTWGGVRYVGLYPGIDLVLEQRDGALLRRFEAAPGADLSQIRVTIEGAETASVDRAGLHLTTRHGAATVPLFELKSATVQLQSLPMPRLTAMELAMPFAPAPMQTAAADFGYFRTFNGNGSEWINQLKVDWSENGNEDVYFTGVTASSSGFPAASGFDTTYNGGSNDAFVGSLQSNGNVRFLTFLGGGGWETGYGLFLQQNTTNAADRVVITGYTNSNNFPTSNNAFDRSGPATDGSDNCDFAGTQAPCYDAFIVRLSSNGTILQASTYVGDDKSDYGTSVWVSKDTNRIWISGLTSSTKLPLPADQNRIYQKQNGGKQDAFWLRFDEDLQNAPEAGSYYGGPEDDDAYSIMVEPGSTSSSGEVVICGLTYSSTKIASGSGYDTTYHGSGDMYVARFGRDNNQRIYGTYLGGAGYDAPYRLYLEWDNELYIAGVTDSNNMSVVDSDALNSRYHGKKDGFIARFSSNGQVLQFSAYWGGSEDDYAYDVTRAVTYNGNPENEIYVVGQTSSPNIQTTRNAQRRSLTHNPSGMVLKFVGGSDPAPSILYSSYVVQNQTLGLYSVGVDVNERIYAGGFQDNQNQAVVLTLDSNGSSKNFAFAPLLRK